MRLNQPPSEKFEVRDMRIKEKFFVDDIYLNGYAKKCGPFASLVYFCLCRHVDKDQNCFPSIDLISKKLAVSEKTVKRAIKTLLDFQIISISKKRTEQGKFAVNFYTLLDKSQWIDIRGSVGPMEEPGVCESSIQGSVGPTKDTATLTTKDTHKHSSDIEVKTTIELLEETFEAVWLSYPRRIGKKAALRHFKASVKSPEDLVKLKSNLEFYKQSKEVQGGFIKHGSTWFNEWQDWAPTKETQPLSDAQKKKDKLARKECIRCAGGKIEEHENSRGEKRMMCRSCGADYTQQLERTILKVA